MFAQSVSTEEVINGFGLQAGIVILALIGALIFTVRLLLKKYTELNDIQEKRIADAKETGTKLVEPIEKTGRITEQIYELLINRRGN